MGIKKDAGELLVFMYNKYIEGDGKIDEVIVKEATKWDAGRINRAIDYLEDIDAIKIIKFTGQTEGLRNFVITDIKKTGIDMIEDGVKFKRNFGIEVGIPGLFKFSWGASER